MRAWRSYILCLIPAIFVAAPVSFGLATSGRHPSDGRSAAEQEPTRPRQTTEAEAQNPEAPDEGLNKLTADERAALTRPDSSKGRIKTYIQLSGARLKNARALLDQENFTAVDDQLLAYAALINAAGRYMAASVAPRDRAYKILEQALREQVRLLEGIRRDVSAAHLDAAERTLATANRVRRQALNALLGDGKSLLKDSDPDQPKKPEGQSR